MLRPSRVTGSPPQARIARGRSCGPSRPSPRVAHLRHEPSSQRSRVTFEPCWRLAGDPVRWRTTPETALAICRALEGGRQAQGPRNPVLVVQSRRRHWGGRRSHRLPERDGAAAPCRSPPAIGRVRRASRHRSSSGMAREWVPPAARLVAPGQSPRTPPVAPPPVQGMRPRAPRRGGASWPVDASGAVEARGIAQPCAHY